MAKEVFAVPIRMSQTKANSQAPPQTLPSSMAMTGAGQRWMARMACSRGSS